MLVVLGIAARIAERIKNIVNVGMFVVEAKNALLLKDKLPLRFWKPTITWVREES